MPPDLCIYSFYRSNCKDEQHMSTHVWAYKYTLYNYGPSISIYWSGNDGEPCFFLIFIKQNKNDTLLIYRYILGNYCNGPPTCVLLRPLKQSPQKYTLSASTFKTIICFWESHFKFFPLLFNVFFFCLHINCASMGF